MTFNRALVAALAIILLATPLKAGTIYEVAPLSLNEGGPTSDVDIGLRAFDSFRLGSAATVREVEWYGFDFTGGQFQVSFSHSAGSVPSATPFFQATVTPTVTPTAGNTSFFSAEIGSQSLDADTDYWLSIFSITANPANFNWMIAIPGSPSDFRTNVSRNLTSGAHTLTFGDLAFALKDDTGVIPIPAALPLLLSGLSGLGLVAWRRRKAT